MLNQKATQNQFTINQFQSLSKRQMNETIKQITHELEDFSIFPNDSSHQYHNFRKNPESQPKIISTKTRRNREKRKFGVFLAQILPGRRYSSETLANIYNNIFESDITRQGLGQMKEIKQHFNKIRRKENGINQTFYILKE